MAARKGKAPPGSHELARALKLAGSQAELARQVGVSPSTVRRWKAQGVPQDRLEQLRVLSVIHAQAPRPKRSETPRELLRRALKRAATPATLARAIGMSASSVRAWVKKGAASTVGAERLKRYLAVQKADQQAARAESKKLEELMGFFGDTIAEMRAHIDNLRRGIELTSDPKAKKELRKKLDALRARLNHFTFTPGEGVRGGEYTQGWQYRKSWNRELTPLLIQRIGEWVRGLKRRYKYWQAVVKMLHFKPEEAAEFKRSGPNVWIQVNPDDQSDVLVHAVMTTERRGSRSTLAGELTGMLEDVLEEGFYAYIVGISVNNYRMRTEKERKQWVRTRKFREQSKRKQSNRKSRKPKALPPKPQLQSKLLGPKP